MRKQKGFAPLIPLLLIAGALITGLILKHKTKSIDSHLEQAAEQVLAKHGIDIDFSSDKKDKLKGGK